VSSCELCSDAADVATVVSVEGSEAVVDAGGRRSRVAIELAAPLAAGDLVLCHAGVALQRVEDA
jgi:hydrogenase maturation factor